MDNFNSADDEDNDDRIVEDSYPSKIPKITMKYENFFEIIKLHPCLFNKSQTPSNKTIKHKALQEVKKKIEKAHGLNLNCSQIRKKLENMKMRAKAKRDKIEIGDMETKFKYYEEELLKLMDYKNYSLTKLITDTEQCDASVDSSIYFKYEAEDEMSQDEEPTSLPPVLSSNTIPVLEIKAETNEEVLQFNEQINEINSKDTDSFMSEEEQLNKFEEKTTPKFGFGIKEQDFFDIIKNHDILFDKSQAPHIKVIKQDALEAVKDKLKTIHGINLNSSQIRKKIDNMKGRVKTRFDRSKGRNASRYILKAHERELLNLMKSKKLLDADLCAELGTSEESNDAAEVNLVKEKTNLLTTSSLPILLNSIPKTSESNQFSLLALQKEVLLEQKDLNRQQNELNNLQKEILTLKKEKLMLELDLLKKTQNV